MLLAYVLRVAHSVYDGLFEIVQPMNGHSALTSSAEEPLEM